VSVGWHALCGVALVLAVSRTGAAEPILYGVGDLPGGATGSYPRAVSADGSTVIGDSQSSTAGGSYLLEAFRWREGTLTGLGTPEDRQTRASAVSGDGAVVVGEMAGGGSGPFGFPWPPEAFRWSASDGLVGLGHLPEANMRLRDRWSIASGVSSDGAVIVGSSNTDLGRSDVGVEAFRWKAGTMQSLGVLEGGSWSRAWAVSGDGSVVVGGADVGGIEQAFRWSAETGIVGLGSLPGGLGESVARDVTPDGSIIVGQSRVAHGGEMYREAFLWTAETGMIDFCDLAFCAVGIFGDVLAVTDDGRTAVGYANTGPVIWHDDTGMRGLTDYLVVDLGLDLRGWHLDEVRDISGDGNAIIGWGRNPQGGYEGWVVAIPEPTTGALLVTGLLVLGIGGRLRMPRSRSRTR